MHIKQKFNSFSFKQCKFYLELWMEKRPIEAIKIGDASFFPFLNEFSYGCWFLPGNHNINWLMKLMLADPKGNFVHLATLLSHNLFLLKFSCTHGHQSIRVLVDSFYEVSRVSVRLT